ncbi:hypothetical protein ABZX92_04945 [Lentzea sp. NPDC006480]|uniref:hypothetical protein n=1 Tax=Lentzea sp. NPDC006480 TaxID=3157176 RepID=UPI0033B05F17
MIERLLGDWYVMATTFPMWTSGRRTHPRFHYEPLSDDRMLDVVSYRDSKGRPKTIEGVDVQLAPGKFRWRGKGALALFTSTWQVEELHDDWALITFTKSLVTPAGADIIARTPELPWLPTGFTPISHA